MHVSINRAKVYKIILVFELDVVMESVARNLLISYVPAGNTRAAGGMVLLCTLIGWRNGSNEAISVVPVYREWGSMRFISGHCS